MLSKIRTVNVVVVVVVVAGCWWWYLGSGRIAYYEQINAA
jgi:hypothetical protein